MAEKIRLQGLGSAPEDHSTVIKMLKKSSGMKILDAAAGEGALTKKLFELDYDVYACDLEPENFKVKEIPCRKVNLNEPLPYENDFFDCVILVATIEHLENPHFAARELKRILKKDGTLIITTPNILNVYSKIRFFLISTPSYFDTMGNDEKYGFWYRKGHINPISFQELNAILRENSFEVEEIKTNRNFLKSSPVHFRIMIYPFIYFLSFLIILATWFLRRKDPLSTNMLSSSLLFGEMLVIKAKKK